MSVTCNIYWDLQNQKFVESTTSKKQISRFDFVLRDSLPVTLRVCTAQASETTPYVAGAIDAGSSIKFGAKALATFTTDTEFLFSQGTWVEAGSGTTTTYTANIPLNTAALIAAANKASAVGYVDCKAEFTILNGSSQHELSTQCTWRIYIDVISGSEGIEPAGYIPIVQTVDDNGNQIVRIVDGAGTLVGVFKNGSPYTFIQSTSLWYPLTATIVDNIPVPAFGAGEVF